MIVDQTKTWPYQADFAEQSELSLDYTQSVTSLEFSQFNLAADDGR